MINLLSYDKKRQVRAARANVTLAKCLILTISAIIFLSIYSIATYNVVKGNNDAGSSTMNNSDQDLDANSSSILTQANSLKAGLASAKSTIDNQISYYDILTEFTSKLPAGVIVESLAITSKSTTVPIVLSLRATSSEKSQLIKDSFKKSTLFTSYNVKNVSEDKNDTSGYRYSISATILLKRTTKR